MGTFLGLRIVNDGTSLSIFALNLAIGLGLGLAIDYSLFVLSRYREEMERDGPGREALRRTLQTAGRTVVFSSLTVAAAMLSLLVFPAALPVLDGVGGALTRARGRLVRSSSLPALLDRPRPARQRARAARAGATATVVTRARLLVPALARSSCAARSRSRVATRRAARRPRHPVHADPVHRRRRERAARRARAKVRSTRAAHASSRRAARRRCTSPSPRRAGIGRRARLRPPAARACPAPPASRPRASSAHGRWLVDVDSRERRALDRATLDARPPSRAAPAPGARRGRRRVGALRRPGSASARACPTRSRSSDHHARDPLRDDRLRRACRSRRCVMNVLGLSATFGLLVLVFQDGRLEALLGYTSQGALELDPAAPAARDRVRALHRLRRLPADAHQGGPRRRRHQRGGGRARACSGRAGSSPRRRCCSASRSARSRRRRSSFVKELGLGMALAVAIDATIVRALLVPALMKLLGDRNWWAPAPLAAAARAAGARRGVAAALQAERDVEQHERRAAPPPRSTARPCDRPRSSETRARITPDGGRKNATA